MGSQRRWRQVQTGDGNLVTWKTKGETVEGRFTGTKEGKYGELAVVKQDDGTVMSVAMPAALVTKFELVAQGSYVRIEFTGWVESPRSGRRYKDFNVFIDDDSVPVADPVVPGIDVPPMDDDIPF